MGSTSQQPVTGENLLRKFRNEQSDGEKYLISVKNFSPSFSSNLMEKSANWGREAQQRGVRMGYGVLQYEVTSFDMSKNANSRRRVSDGCSA
jgi:hypothetical protein